MTLDEIMLKLIFSQVVAFGVTVERKTVVTCAIYCMQFIACNLLHAIYCMQFIACYLLQGVLK